MKFMVRHRYVLVLITALVAFIWLGLTRNLGAGTDDVFITLYAGQALSDGEGIVNYNGERVEMSSSLLHTLVVAAIHEVAPNYVFTLNKLVGAACGALTLVVLYLGRAVLFRAGRWRFAAYTMTLLLVATNPAFVYWSFGGLEAPFATLFLATYAVSLLDHRRRPTAVNETSGIGSQCLYIMTRPEGFFLLLFTAVYLTLMKRYGRRALRLRIVLFPLAFFTGVTTFRWFYFGALMPNTVYAKSGGIIEGIANGLTYAANFYNASALLVCALLIQVVLGLVFARSLVYATVVYPRRVPLPLATTLLFGLTLATQLVVLCSGGDWMGHFRFFVPVIPLLTPLVVTQCAEAFGATHRRVANRYVLYGTGAVLAVCALIVNPGQSAINTPRMLPLRNGDFGLPYSLLEVVDQAKSIDDTVIRLNGPNRGFLRSFDRFLDERFTALHEEHRPLVIATGQMGLFPYRIKRQFPDADVRFIDTLGLCDATVAHLPMPKDPIGLKDGRFVDVVLAGNAGPLSDYMFAQEPNMAYMLGGGIDLTENIARMEAIGFTLVWDLNYEFIFLRPRD